MTNGLVHDDEINIPSIVNLLQRIVDKEGWVSGNSVVFTVDAQGTGSATDYYKVVGLPGLVNLEVNYSPSRNFTLLTGNIF